MAAPRKERAYEKYAWILLFVSGLLALIVSVFIIVVPAPIGTAGVRNLTGITWEQIVSQSPAAAKLTAYFIAQFGIAQAGLGVLTMGISALGYRRGERWAWYVLWFVPIVGFGIAVKNLAVGGAFWLPPAPGGEGSPLLLTITLLGLLLPYRKFFPKKQ